MFRTGNLIEILFEFRILLNFRPTKYRLKNLQGKSLENNFYVLIK